MTSRTIVEIRHPRGRAIGQSVVFVLVMLLGLAFLAFGVWSIVVSGVDGIVVGIIAGLIGLIATLISLAVLWTLLPAATGRAEPALRVDHEGIRWHQGLFFPWDHISGLTIRTDTSISFAGGADAALDRAAEQAMAAAGVGDGTRAIVVHVRDAAAARTAAGTAAALISDGPAPGEGSATLILDAISDGPTFATAVTALAEEAGRRGVPVRHERG